MYNMHSNKCAYTHYTINMFTYIKIYEHAVSVGLLCTIYSLYNEYITIY